MAQSDGTAPDGKGLFYGWVMVAVAALGMFASGPGQSHTFSVFLDPIKADLEISGTAISIAYGLATLAAAFLLPQVGKMVDRFGPRKALLAISTLLGFACFFFGAAANFLWLVIGFGLLRFMGQGSMMLGSSNLVAQWFQARRGAAMGLMGLGFSASMAIHPQLGQLLIDAYGWRTAWVGLGLMTWVMMLPVVFFVVRDRPEDMGLLPDGAGAPTDGSAPPAQTGLDAATAYAHPSFWIISLVWFTIGMLVTALHFHQVSVMTHQGVAAEWATTSFSISAVTMAVTIPFVGRLFDNIRSRVMIALEMALITASLLLVISATGPLTVVLYAFVFGLTNALMLTMFGYLWPRYFGRLHLGQIQGRGQLIGVIGASLGPLPIGFAFDSFGDPTAMIIALALFPVIVGLIVVVGLRTHPDIAGVSHLD